MILGSQESCNTTAPRCPFNTTAFNTTAGASGLPRRDTPSAVSTRNRGLFDALPIQRKLIAGSGKFDDAGILQGLAVGAVYPAAGRTALPGGFEYNPDELAAVGSG